MTDYEKRLEIPKGKIDAVLDTDAYNEIDDQYAIAFMVRSKEKINVKAMYAAPFFNSKVKTPGEGMQKSFDEIIHILTLCGEDELCKNVFPGSESYLKDEGTPVESIAARDLVERSKGYDAARPLYVVAIGAITNVASALIMDPTLKDRIVVVWLGGHAHFWDHTKEFNMVQDIAAARVVMGCGVPFIQLPCMGVVSDFRISGPELEYWLVNKNPLADYLARHAIEEAESYAKGTSWTRIIWDVTAVAFLLNDDDKYMYTELRKTRLPAYTGVYEKEPIDRPQRYVKAIRRDKLMTDLIKKLI